MQEPDEDFVESIGEMINYFLDLRGLPETDCSALAAAVTDQIRERYQGERVTIRKIAVQQKEREELRQRVRQAKASGCSIKQIQARFKIARSTVFKYLQS